MRAMALKILRPKLEEQDRLVLEGIGGYEPKLRNLGGRVVCRLVPIRCNTSLM